jgi:hypothetical protein
VALRVGLAIAVWLTLVAPASAEMRISVGGGSALVNAPDKPRAALVLIPGGDGKLGLTEDGTVTRLNFNQLVRTRQDYMLLGLATLTVDHDVFLPDAVAYMRATYGVPVVVVATSRGALRAASALDARPDALVLTAAMLETMKPMLEGPESLPPLLLIHHRKDACWATTPAAAERFAAWAGDKAELLWMEGGIDEGDPCRPMGHHGFNGLDDKVVAATAEFAMRRREK